MERLPRTRKTVEAVEVKFLRACLREAEKALQKNEVPVGAIVVHNGKIIARAHNLREQKQSPVSHAEIEVLLKAAKKLGTWRLSDCDVYVSLEPCPMCAGALSQARVRSVFYGARDPKGGAISLGIKIHEHPRLNHRYKMNFILLEECGTILTNFFKKKRGSPR